MSKNFAQDLLIRELTDTDYLKAYDKELELPQIQKELRQREKFLYNKNTPPFWQSLAEQPSLHPRSIDLHHPVLHIGDKNETTSEQNHLILEQLSLFMPWRKGPFNIFGHYIDAEWRSDFKWRRIEPFLPPLEGKRIADVGCNNGYYMFRMAPFEPELVLGIDPVPRYKFSFHYLQRFARVPNLHMELLGYENLELFPDFFDIIFLLGIVYHHRSPIQVLQQAWNALKPHGLLILDSLGIPGEGDYALFPQKRYAKAPGVWFVPTQSTLENWLLRANFTNSQLIYNHVLPTTEQRRTKWCHVESLAEFLDPDDPALTIEGYPRPLRIYYLADKKPR